MPALNPPTIVAIASYVIVAGIFTQSGVILGPASTWFHSSVPRTAVLFSFLSAGNLAGIVASGFILSLWTVRNVLCVAYAIFFAGIALVTFTHGLSVACIAVTLVGFGAGTGLSSGAVILAKLYRERLRAIAFLSTDCAFSAAGYVFPSAVGALLAAGWPWQSGYLLVAVVAAAVLVAATRIRFPQTQPPPRAIRASADPANVSDRAAFVRIGCFAVALLLYLTGQSVFTLWAPSDLQGQFGLSAPAAGAIVGTFFGASSAGLLVAALIVTRVAPRVVLALAIGSGTLCTFALARTADANTFFALTVAFGFTSTCMFKIMLSIGSEQLVSSPPRLVTLLLFCASLGGVAAPAISAPIVERFGVHAALFVCFWAYAAALVFVAAALLLERRSGGSSTAVSPVHAAR